eukprot:TRINITY_DN3640_c1_g1_i1.p1 TRINITY_DN3640_c1_g1~~TRINITY_DN3640_c1_g1_i1.p1  ORF type:complete len:254 (+),score=74.84 TRINITY_DN3640_c1_g1_i1:59-820(+)
MNAGKRIRREAEQLRKKPCREFLAYPSENEFVWLFTMRGPEESPYEEGVYHGKILLPMNYPYGPPDVLLLTPNGRFEVNLKICLSEVTSYHPENWQPSWGVHTVLHALRGFMKTPGNNAIGAIEYPEAERRRLAKESRTWTSADGTRMEEHLRLLDASPPWAERNVSSSAQAEEEEAKAQAQARVEEVPAEQAVQQEPAPQAAQPQRQAAQPEQQHQAMWQVQESSLNNFIMFLLVGIIAILSKKYLQNELGQ